MGEAKRRRDAIGVTDERTKSDRDDAYAMEVYRIERQRNGNALADRLLGIGISVDLMRQDRATADGEWHNGFPGAPLSAEGISATRRELARAKRYWRRKAARAGTRGRRGALNSRQVAELEVDIRRATAEHRAAWVTMAGLTIR
jgi:hypothetical protein